MSAEDLQGDAPPGGARVSFLAYADGDGIGAEQVRLETDGEDGQLSGAGAAPPAMGRHHGRWGAPWSGGWGAGAGWADGSWGGGWGGEGTTAASVRRTIEKFGLGGADGAKGWGRGKSPGKGKGAALGKGKGKAKAKGGAPSMHGVPGGAHVGGHGSTVILVPGPGRPFGPDRDKTTTLGEASVLSWVVSEMRGWRPAMEDATCALFDLEGPLARHALFGIFDGHGGAAVSRRAASELPGVVVEHTAALQSGDLEDGDLADLSFKLAFPAWDSVLRESGDGVPGFLPTSSSGVPIHSDVANAFALTGTTVVLALVECDGPPRESRPVRVTVANCGDSRALLCRGGKAVSLSEDHKPDLPTERARIEKAGGHVASVGPCQRIDGWGLNLSRALGDFHYKARKDLLPQEQKVSCIPEVLTCELTTDDEFLFLGCDGVFELHSSQDVIDRIRAGLLAGKALQAVVEELVDASCSESLFETQGRGGDNVSAMVVLLR